MTESLSSRFEPRSPSRPVKFCGKTRRCHPLQPNRLKTLLQIGHGLLVDVNEAGTGAVKVNDDRKNNGYG